MTTKTQTKRGRPATKSAISPVANSEKLIKDMRRATKRIFSSEQKTLIVMEGIRAEVSVAELCRKYGISTQTYYTWNKEFIEAGKRQLAGESLRGATSDEIRELVAENKKLKESLADLVVRYDIVKKSLRLFGEQE